MKKNDKVLYKGEVAVVYQVNGNKLTLDTGMAPMIYEVAEINEVTLLESYEAPVDYDKALWEAQCKEAEANTLKDIKDLKVGDLLYMIMFGGKNGGGDVFDLMYWSGPYRRMVRIEKIIANISIDTINSQKFEFGEGGSSSDCLLDDNIPAYKLTETQRQTIYSNVTLLIMPDGRYLACDAQGYSYPRYILAPENWGEMFKAEIAEAKRKREEYKAQQQAEFLAERAEEKAAAELFVREVLIDKGFVPAKQPKTNVKRILDILAPDCEFKVTQNKIRWENSSEVVVTTHPSNISRLQDLWEMVMEKIWYRTGEHEWEWNDQFGSSQYEVKQKALDAPLGCNVRFEADKSLIEHLIPMR